MTPLRAEFWLLRRDRAAMSCFAVAVLISALAVVIGGAEVSSQRDTLVRLQNADTAARQQVAQEQTDWGGLAYYTFHLTFDPPSPFAFAALGQRDTAPWRHRIRMLALEGQIYETDASNPALALVGRLDFAFVGSMLLPLLILFLIHNLRADERSAGRWELLLTTAENPKRFWIRRVIVRIGPLLLCLLAPLVVGALLEQSDPLT